MTDFTYEGTTLKEVRGYVTEITLLQTCQYIYGETQTKYAFYLCKDTIEKVVFPKDSELLEIQSYSFYDCSKLTSIDLSPCTKLTTISNYAFAQCSIESITLPTSGSLKTFGNYVFYTSLLKSIIIPASLTKSGTFTFHTCSYLTSCTFEKGSHLETLPSRFLQASAITTFEVPNGISSISYNSLEGTKSLTTLTVEAGSIYFVAISNIIYDISMKNLIVAASNMIGTVTLPEGVADIGSVAFTSSKISHINLPQTLLTIGGWSFNGASITEIEMPDSLVSIGTCAFVSCQNLKSVKFSKNLTTLSESAFRSSGLENITIPDTITTIEDSCFEGCSMLVFVILPDSIQHLGGGVFSNCPSNLKVTFAEDSKFFLDDQYLIMDLENISVSSYIGSSTSIIIPRTVKTIQSSAFISQNTLQNITFEEGSQLETIEDSAFSYCISLKVINIPTTLQTIGINAFYQCSSIQNLIFGSSLTTLSQSSFSYAASLKTISFKASQVTSLPNSLFLCCTSLETIELPSSLDSIGETCFQNCTKLRTITFPSAFKTLSNQGFMYSAVEEIIFESLDNDAFTIIPDNAFYYATKLSKISIPNYVTYIGDKAFYMTNITEITLPQNVREIAGFCFSCCKMLKKFVIPKGSQLTSIGSSFLENCPSLEVIQSNISTFTVENGALYNSNRSQLYAFPAASHIKYFYFPETVKNVMESSFYGSNLYSILIPENSVESIGYQAFAECKNLRVINIPRSVKTIGKYAFMGCKSIKCGLQVENSSNVIRSQLYEAGLTQEMLRDCMAYKTLRCKSYTKLLSPKFFAIILLF